MGAPDFDDARLDDEDVLVRHDTVLRQLAATGARIRTECGAAMDSQMDFDLHPRGIVLAGLESRLIHSAMEATCPAPLVAWPREGLPGWTGPLDLVVVQATGGPDAALPTTVIEAARRGCTLLVAAPAIGIIAEQIPNRGVVKLITTTGDPVAASVALLDVLARAGLGPEIVTESIAEAADMVAEECSPHRDQSSNPAKSAAIALADAQPLVWGGSMLAARAARRVAEELRRVTGRAALAAPAGGLAPLLAACAPRDPFADPDDQPSHPVLVSLDDGDDAPIEQHERVMLENIAESHQLRVLHLVCDDEAAGPVGRHVVLRQKGLYAAAFLGVGLDALSV